MTVGKQSLVGWQKDKATVWCAALAYYTVFSIGPLLLLIISVLGLVLSKTTIEKNIYAQLGNLVGSNGISFLSAVVSHAKKPSASVIGTIIGTVTLILGATGVFGQLQQMLNSIWGVSVKPKAGIINLIKSRLLNISLVGVIAFLLLVSLVASALISGIGTYMAQMLPFSALVIESINLIVSFIITSFLFAVILKVLPDVQIGWKRVWNGALVTAFLFTIGKTLIGLYIGHSGVTSEYGAAASLIVLLLWVYYTSQILFLGAEFTKAEVLMSGGEIIPSEHAMLNKTIEKTKQGTKNFVAEATIGFVEGAMTEAVKEVHDATDTTRLKKKSKRKKR